MRPSRDGRHFAGVALRALVFDLKQMSRYLQEPDLRRAARARVTALIGPDTRVVVAHSFTSCCAGVVRQHGGQWPARRPRRDRCGSHALGRETWRPAHRDGEQPPVLMASRGPVQVP
ncbi:MAG: hypothetical protein ACRDS1_11175, partial [Pseudonocardiaceae bacterium]